MKLIEDSWQQYLTIVLDEFPENTPQGKAALQAMKDTFMAGAMVLDSLYDKAGEMPTGKGMMLLAVLREELEQYRKNAKLRAEKTGGSA